MKKEFCLTIAVFVFSLVLGTDMSFGLDRELYLQYTEQIIERMEAGTGHRRQKQEYPSTQRRRQGILQTIFIN